MEYRYSVVDVFTRQAFNGAQITVFTQAAGLSERQMQQLANETNHSETVFVIPGEDNIADLRVYSPRAERSAGSHTTVAAAYALAEEGSLQFAGDQCLTAFKHAGGKLDVVLRREDGRVQTRLSQSVAPQIDRYVPDHNELMRILGLGERDIEQISSRPLFVSAESSYLIVPLRSLGAVYKARYHSEAWAQSSASSVPVAEILLYCRETEQARADFHLRLLGPQIAPQDDPPVGAAVSAFAAYLSEVQNLGEGTHALCLERGLASQRQSLLAVEFEKRASAALQLRVGGDAVIVGRGSMQVPDAA